jgi:hypothetical protein
MRLVVSEAPPARTLYQVKISPPRSGSQDSERLGSGPEECQDIAGFIVQAPIARLKQLAASSADAMKVRMADNARNFPRSQVERDRQGVGYPRNALRTWK